MTFEYPLSWSCPLADQFDNCSLPWVLPCVVCHLQKVTWFSLEKAKFNACMLVACAEVKHAWVSPSVFGESSIVLLVSQVIERFSIKSYWHILYINPSCANSHVASFYHNELSMSLPFLVRRLCPPWTALEPAMACVAFVLRLQSTALWNSPRTCSNFYDSMHFNRRGLLGFVAMKSVHIT